MTNPSESEADNSVDFDFAYFDTYTSGDEALQREVLQLFFGQIDGLLEDLDPDSGAKDWHAGAHAIKGGARGIGLGVVADLCQEMEEQKDGDTATRRTALEDLKAALDKAAQNVAGRYEGIFGG